MQPLFNSMFFTLNVLHIVKSNIFFYKCPKYEIISLTFGSSKVSLKKLVNVFGKH
jgi:hypothetical protein